jgi:hypothetical protein
MRWVIRGRRPNGNKVRSSSYSLAEGLVPAPSMARASFTRISASA